MQKAQSHPCILLYISLHVLVDFYGELVGKYTVRPRGCGMGKLRFFPTQQVLRQLRPLCQCAIREANTACEDEGLIHPQIQGGPGTNGLGQLLEQLDTQVQGLSLSYYRAIRYSGFGN